MMSMWEYEEAQHQAHERALVAGFNFPHNPKAHEQVEESILSELVTDGREAVNLHAASEYFGRLLG